MKLPRTLAKITRSILVFSLVFSMQTSIVLADDATTPEPAVSEQAPAEDAVAPVENTPEPENTAELPVETTEPALQPAEAESETPVGETEPPAEPTTVVEETRVVENTAAFDETEDPGEPVEPTDETEVSEATPTAEADLEPEISEILAAANDADVELIPLGDEDEIVAMGSNEAAEILSGGDPYFKDASGNWIGYTGLGGTCPAIVTTCNQVATPVQAAIDAAPVDATIYVEKATYVEDIVINKSLSITGLWEGNEDYTNRPTLQGSVLITADNVYFENWIVDASGETYGIEIQGAGVTVNNSLISNALVANIFINSADLSVIANNTIENSGTGDGILVTNANYTDIEENVINNNGHGSGGSAGGINLISGSSTTIYQNNITNNEVGIINGTGIAIDATANYFNGNLTNTLGPVFINTSYPEVSLPYDWGFPPAPGTIPNDEITPPSDDFVEFYHPIDGDNSELDCGMIWDANMEINTGGDFQRYVNDVWVRYDADLGGWIHDMGTEDNAQYLRKADGSWYILSDGSPTVMPNVTDKNWSVLDGNWCLNPGGGHLMYEDCFLYYYENGTFKWAQSTQDGSNYDYDITTSSWVIRN